MNDCVLGFNGERLDPVSGTTHLGNGYRAYNPVLMRFNCPDSMSPFGAGGINPYAYCGGDPVNRADPSGHWSLGQWLGLAAGLLAGIALTAITAGAALPVLAAIAVEVAAGAVIGAGCEILTDAVDGKQVDWGQVGIAAGIGGSMGLLGYGAGKLGKWAYGGIKGFINRFRMKTGLRKIWEVGLSGIGEEDGTSGTQGLNHFAGRTTNNERFFLGLSRDRVAYAFGHTNQEGERILSVYGHGGIDSEGSYYIFNDGKLRGVNLHDLLIDKVRNYKSYNIIKLDFCHSSQDIGSIAEELSMSFHNINVGGYDGPVYNGFVNRLAAEKVTQTQELARGMQPVNYEQLSSFFMSDLTNTDFSMVEDLSHGHQSSPYAWFRNGGSI